MRSTLRLLLGTAATAAAAVSIITSPAFAALPEPLQRATRVASDHWPASPCRGHEDVRYLQPRDFAVRYPHAPDLVAIADSAVGPCIVIVDLGQFLRSNSPGRCMILEHEFGHLAGHRHSRYRDNVMYPYIDPLFADFTTDCSKAFTRYPAGPIGRSLGRR